MNILKLIVKPSLTSDDNTLFFSYYLLHGVKGVLKSGGFHPTMAKRHHSPANRNTKIVANRRIGKRTIKPTKICQNKTYCYILSIINDN